MKFWALTSVCREEPHLLERLGDHPAWRPYLEWVHEHDRLVRDQDRAKLDAEVPEEAAIHVLTPSTAKFYLSGGYVRVWSMEPPEEVLTAAEVVQRFGGDFLEEVCERGVSKVAPAG